MLSYFHSPLFAAFSLLSLSSSRAQLLSNLSLFNLSAGCFQGGQIPRPRGGKKWHGDAHSLKEAALNQKNLCLLPRTHCQVLVQHGMWICRRHALVLPFIKVFIFWWFIWLEILKTDLKTERDYTEERKLDIKILSNCFVKGSLPDETTHISSYTAIPWFKASQILPNVSEPREATGVLRLNDVTDGKAEGTQPHKRSQSTTNVLLILI